MEMNNEILQKAKDAKSAQELMDIAKESNVEMTEESAQAYFELLNERSASGELPDTELENVSGGGCRKNGKLVVSALHHCDEFGFGTWCCECQYCKYTKGLWLCSRR